MYKLIFIFLCFQFTGFAQTKVYRGNYANLNSLIYEITNREIVRVNSIANKSGMLFLEGNKIYLNQRKSFTDVKFTVRENKLFKGDSDSSFDVLYTLKEGKVYVGEGRYGEVILYTLKDGMVYQGDSTSSFNQIMTYELEKESDLILIVAAIAPF